MDLGESLNPAVDIGQIEGGFMQGYGLFVMEQLIHSPSGALLTKGKILDRVVSDKVVVRKIELLKFRLDSYSYTFNPNMIDCVLCKILG